MGVTRGGRLAGFLNDMHQLDLATLAWTDLSQAAAGTPPAPRESFVFAAARGADGAETLLLFGGKGSTAQGLLPLPLPPAPLRRHALG